MCKPLRTSRRDLESLDEGKKRKKRNEPGLEPWEMAGRPSSPCFGPDAPPVLDERQSISEASIDKGKKKGGEGGGGRLELCFQGGFFLDKREKAGEATLVERPGRKEKRTREAGAGQQAKGPYELLHEVAFDDESARNKKQTRIRLDCPVSK